MVIAVVAEATIAVVEEIDIDFTSNRTKSPSGNPGGLFLWGEIQKFKDGPSNSDRIFLTRVLTRIALYVPEISGYVVFLNHMTRFESILRAASVEHIPTIQNLAYITWPPTFHSILSEDQISYMLDQMYNTPELRSQIQNPKFQYYLIHRDAGFAAVEFHYQDTTDTKIHKLYILPSHQGKGWGRDVIMELRKIAKRQGDQALILNVNKNNKATEFYEKCGFIRWKSEVIDIGKGYVMDDYVYRLEFGD